ncbi:transcriptional regulator [Frankia nepalensis]|uniref:transcriptional regulator n=1 Tax=Frankia nepalensis TaxID=1836974 RepID=UPI0027DDDD4D|nr:transcriptional regulator [Frankia nepalensis]
MTVDGPPHALTDSERAWLRVRDQLKRHRHELAVAAAGQYPAATHVAGTPLLADPRWLPPVPIDLSEVDLQLVPDRPAGGLTGREPVSEAMRPLRRDGSRHDTYAAAVATLAPPAVFANLPTYRLLEADLAGGRGRMVFRLGRYFDGLNVGEACAHEYAAHVLEGGGQPLRAAVGDPRDLTRRAANLAISTLTLRLDRAAGTATFLLHLRDPAKVGHAGGLYQVIPAGIFQPAGPAPWNERNDFDLWRSMVREFAEELGGEPEGHGSDLAPVDYAAWPFAARLTRARAEGGVRVRVLGMGTDPLTFATDLLTVAVFDAPTFDAVFGARVDANDEGQVLSALDGATGTGIAFDQANVDRLTRREPMQAAGAALLALAWRHRGVLLRDDPAQTG